MARSSTVAHAVRQASTSARSGTRPIHRGPTAHSHRNTTRSPPSPSPSQSSPSPSSSSLPPGPSLIGRVTSSGRMQRAVTVTISGQTYERDLRRLQRDRPHHLVSDPSESARQGDVVRIAPLRVSTRIAHVLDAIVTPFGEPREARPEVPGLEGALERRSEKAAERARRKAARADMAEAADTETQGLGQVQAQAQSGQAKAVRGELTDEDGIPVRHTPTSGRIGKAGKGLPVHAFSEGLVGQAEETPGEQSGEDGIPVRHTPTSGRIGKAGKGLPVHAFSEGLVGQAEETPGEQSGEDGIPVRHTPTSGRISKAKKGLPVHQCTYGCGKV